MRTIISSCGSGDPESAFRRIPLVLFFFSFFLALLLLPASGETASQKSLPGQRKSTPAKQVSAAKSSAKTGARPKKASALPVARKDKSASRSSAARSTQARQSRAEEKRKALRERGIYSGYGPRSLSKSGKVTRFHKGVDISAPTGSKILAFNDGVVVSSERHRNYGINVVVRQLDGRYARYAHMSKSLVKAGQKVIRGEHIGAVGRTGRATGPHLHFELFEEGGHHMDPAEHFWLGSELVIGPHDQEPYKDAPSLRTASIELLKDGKTYTE